MKTIRKQNLFAIAPAGVCGFARVTRLISDAVDRALFTITPKSNKFGYFTLLVSLHSLWG